MTVTYLIYFKYRVLFQFVIPLNVTKGQCSRKMTIPFSSAYDEVVSDNIITNGTYNLH